MPGRSLFTGCSSYSRTATAMGSRVVPSRSVDVTVDVRRPGHVEGREASGGVVTLGPGARGAGGRPT